MAFENFTNFAKNTLNGGITDTANTLTLNDASDFPTASFYAVIDSDQGNSLREIVWCSTRSGNTLNIVRGQLGTSGHAHANSAVVVQSTLAHHLARALKANVDEPLWVPPQSPHTLNDEYDDASIHSDWVRVDRSGNSSGLTWTEAHAMSLLHIGFDNSQEFHALLRPMTGISSPPVTVESAIRNFGPYATNYSMSGIGFADGITYGSGKQLFSNGYSNSSNGSGLNLSLYGATGFNSIPSSWGAGQYQSPGAMMWYHKVRWNTDGTWSSWISPDNISWLPNGVNVTYAGLTPTYFGLFQSHYGGTLSTVTTFEYFRVSLV